MKNNNMNSGFTLVEMVIYTAIVAVFVTGLVSFGINLIYGRVKSFTQQEINQNIRVAVKKINYEIRNASAVNSVGANSISLASADSARNPTVIDVSGGRLRVGYGSAGNCPTTAPCYITDNLVSVTNLAFTNLSVAPSSVNIGFTLTVAASGVRPEQNWTETYRSAAEMRSE